MQSISRQGKGLRPMVLTNRPHGIGGNAENDIRNSGEMSEEDDSPMWFTTTEVAAQLRIPEPTIRKLLRQGKLPGVQIGKPWRIPADYAKKLVSAS